MKLLGTFPESSGRIWREAAGGPRWQTLRRQEIERSGLPLAWLVFPCRSAASRAAFNSGYLICLRASSLKLETAPTAGPWPQAAMGWTEPGLGGSAACLSYPALGSYCLPCLKGQTSSHSFTQPPFSVPPWQLYLHREIAYGPDIRRTGNAHCRSPAAQIPKPCLACCIAPASPTHARVMQLSLSCCGLVGGAQARDCNLLQTQQSASTQQVSNIGAAQHKLL